MLKRGIILLLIVCTVMANFTSLIVFAGFEMNRKYIAGTLCENRNKPWLHCNGRCYLMKKIKLAQDKEKNEARETQKNLVQLAYCSVADQIKFPSCLLQVFSDTYHPGSPHNITPTLLRPPQFAS